MRDANPYRAPSDPRRNTPVRRKPRSKWRWALTGFALGASLPVGFGIYGMQQHYAYVASLGPNEAACGTAALGFLTLIVVVGPFCGMIGAASGWIASGIDWWAAL